MNVTLSFELNHKSNRNGLNQVYIRVTYNRKIKRKKTGILVTKTHFNPNGKIRKWIKSCEDESSYKNEKLYALYKQMENNVDEFIRVQGSFDIEQFFNPIKEEPKTQCYFQFAHTEYKQQMAADKIGTGNKRKVNHQRLSYFFNQKKVDYEKSKTLLFSDITPEFLEKFRNWMRNRNLKYNTRVSTIKDVRTLFNLAIKRDLVDDSLSPFKNGKFVLGEMVSSHKEKLNKEEVSLLLKFNTENVKLQLAVDCFLFSFFANGMRSSDIFMLKWSNVANGHLSYRMIKNNKLVGDVHLPQRALDILERYKGKNKEYIFPIFYDYSQTSLSARKQNSKTASSLTMINKDLKTIAKSCGIDKNLTMHIARHSFANIAKDEGVSAEFIMEALVHSSLATTYKYLGDFSSEKLQSATNKVYKNFG